MTKVQKYTFYFLLIIFSISMLGGGYADLALVPQAAEILIHLGYPLYFGSILGVAKILGVIALWQPKYKTVKEWAFAGFTFDLIGAIWSHTASGDALNFNGSLPASIHLVILVVIYYLYKKKTASIVN